MVCVGTYAADKDAKDFVPTFFARSSESLVMR